MFERLFEPIKIGPVELKNRIAVAPMNQQGDRDGHPTLQYTCFFTARALGGFGLLTTGSILTSREAREEYPFVPCIYPSAFNAGYWLDFVEGVHSMGTGAKLFAQMSPGFGRQTGRSGVRGASPIPFKREDLYDGWTKEMLAWTKYWIRDFTDHLLGTPREMTVDEIQRTEEGFVRACAMAILYGFDGIEIHAPHGYLLHQFLSPRSNQRQDQYGGSLRNRARFLLELVDKCKQAFGSAVPIVVRVSGREYQPGGLTAEDVRQICIWCEEAGADAISLSNGSGYDDFRHFFPTTRDNDALLQAQGKALKKVIKIPVITTGLHTPEVAEQAIKEGATDIVALGRQAIADPEWPNKVREGRINEIVRCTKDCYCVAMSIAGAQGSARCTQNPNYGKEQYMPQYWPKPMKGRIPDTLRRWKPGELWQALGPFNEYWSKAENKPTGNI